MKKINVLMLCLVAAVGATLYSMNENDDEIPELDLERLTLQEREAQAPPIPRRTPLQDITRSESRSSGSRTGTPLGRLRPINPDGRPGTPTGTPTPRAATGTPTHVTPEVARQMNALLLARSTGEIDDAELGRRVRELFPAGGIPTPRRAGMENVAPESPNINRD